MAKFLVQSSFIFNEQLARGGGTLTVSDAVLKKEIARGNHPKKDKPLSGLLVHCIPADEATAEIINKSGILKDGVSAPGEEGEEETPGEEDSGALEPANERESLRAEFDKLGAAYDKRWNTAKLRNELIKAKKMRGV